MALKFVVVRKIEFRKELQIIMWLGIIIIMDCGLLLLWTVWIIMERCISMNGDNLNSELLKGKIRNH